MFREKKIIASLPRAISKLGFASRSAAAKLIASGKVKVNGKTVKDVTARVDLARDKIEIKSEHITPAEKVYYLLNKPRGLVTTASDEKGRDSVFKCFEGKDVPYIFPVGRLDKASEGMLLFTNDSVFADRITSPLSKTEKTYHIQINTLPDEELIERLLSGIEDKDDILKAEKASVIRTGKKNCWIEITLTEGKNRHIRRIFESQGIEILRLIRISIGSLKLGQLMKGEFRSLTEDEVNSLIN